MLASMARMSYRHTVEAVIRVPVEVDVYNNTSDGVTEIEVHNSVLDFLAEGFWAYDVEILDVDTSMTVRHD